MTEKYGLNFSEGKKNVKRERLKGEQKVKYEIYDALTKAVPLCKNWQDLDILLNIRKIEIHFKTKGNSDKIEGVIFSKGKHKFSGSKIDKQFSYGNLEKLFSEKLEQSISQKIKSQDDDITPRAEVPSPADNSGIAFSGDTSRYGSYQHVGEDEESENDKLNREIQKRKKGRSF